MVFLRGSARGSILKNPSKVGSSSCLDPHNSSINLKKKATFKEELVEIREVESFKDFNYEHTYNVDNSQCKCDCSLIWVPLSNCVHISFLHLHLVFSRLNIRVYLWGKQFKLPIIGFLWKGFVIILMRNLTKKIYLISILL